MRLAAIYNVWSDAIEILPYSVKNMFDCGVDGVIIVWSEASNFGEIDKDYCNKLLYWPSRMPAIEFFQREPQFRDPRNSETDKRNFGINQARKLGYTHFLSLDCDELYEPDEFLKAKEMFHVEHLKGLVCNCQTYFGSPELTFGLDTTLVPFIHELTPTIKHEFNRKYPFAWIDGQIRIDPTRSFNITSGVERIDLNMHHYSWVRSDYAKKIRNSTARKNLERSNILNQAVDAKEGDFIDFYRKRLTRCPNRFGIHVTEGEGIIHKDL